MKSVFKKSLAVLSAVLMLITALSTMVYAASPADYSTITLNAEHVAVIGTDDEMAYFAFTPEASGLYNFTSYADFDTYGYLYNADMEEIDCNDDDGEDTNFSLTRTLTAGETYYFGARRYDRAPGSFTVKLTKMPGVSRIDVNPLEMIELSDGSWDYYWDDETQTGSEYYCYYWWNRVTYTVYLEDGTVLDGHGTQCHDGNGRYLTIDHVDEQGIEHWTVGNTYYTTISLMGYETTASVTIVESPVQSIQVAPITMIENYNGGWNWATDEEGQEHKYFVYTWSQELSYTITLKDGSVITGRGNYFTAADGNQYRMDTRDEQNFYEPWTVGNTYRATASVWGYSTTVSISIVESPVDAVNMEPIEMVENTKGEELEYWEDTTGEMIYYYRYHWWNHLRGTITLNDGTVLTANGGGFYDEYDNWYGINYNDEQTGYAPWTVGNTYEVTISVLGKDIIVPVIITEHPIVSINMSPIYLDRDRDSWENEEWNEELGQWVSFDQYSWYSKLNGTVTFRDGSTAKLNGSGMEYNGDWYSASAYTYDQQNYQNPWVVGGVYTIYIEVMGITTQVSAYVVEPQVSGNVKYLEQENSIIITGTVGEGDSLTIPDTINNKPVTAITSLYGGDYAEIIIPDSVLTMSSSALDECYDLTRIVIGAGVEELNDDMFYGAEYLQSIVVSEDHPYYTSVDGILYDKKVSTMVAIPRGKTTIHTVPATVINIELYIEGNYSFGIILQNDATGYVVEDGIMYNADKTTIISCDPGKTGNYVMPETVTTIKSMAFWYTNLESVTVSSNVTDIVYYSFADSNTLQKVVLPEGLQSIGFHAFSGCENLTDISLPSTLTTLDTSCFANTGIRSATIPGGVLYVSNSAFAYSDLESLTISEGVEGLGGSAFYATKVKNVTLPNSLTWIGSSAFGNSALQSVKFGTGTLEISYYAFSNTKLTSVTIPSNVVYLGEGAFSNCPIKTLNIAEGLSSTGDYAFYNSDLTSLTLPNSVTNVAYYSFASSDKLASIDLPENLESLCGHAFDGTAWLKNQADGVVYLEQVLYGYKGTMPAKTTISVKSGTTIISDFAFDSGYYEDWEYVTDNKLTKVILPKSIQHIGYAAFAGCAGITDVYYAGTEAEAKQIYIGENNAYLEKATWHYNYTCEHDYKKVVVTKATTTKDGKYKNVCEKCGYTASKQPTIYKASKVSLSKTSYTYNGKVQKPSVVVKDSQGKTISTAHYSVSYSSGCKNAGTYSVKVTFKGNYSGTKTLTYKINPISVSKCKISLSKTSYTYNGKVQKPSVTVKDSQGKTISSSNYTVTYASGRKNIGTYKVTIKMKGNYSGTKTLTFKILPTKTTLGTLTAAKKALTVKWTKKTTQVTGYQIQYSTTKSFKSYKTKTVSKNSTTSVKLTGLKAKTTYYVRVRTYKTVNGTKYYSGWSTIKVKKTK